MHEPATDQAGEASIGHGFEEVIRKMDLIAIHLDRHANLTFCNSYFLKITGWLHHEVHQANWFERFLPAEAQDLRELFALALTGTPETWHHENEILSRSGERILVQWNNSPLRDREGRVVGVACIGEDITERRFLERQVLESVNLERRSLCANLHDGLAQLLWGARLHLDSVRSAIGKASSASLSDLDQLSKILEDSIATCHAFMKGLSPEFKTDLISALQSLSEGSPISRTQVKFSQTGSAALRLQGSAADHLFRIAQEATTNARKHAASSVVEIELNIGEDRVVLSISDHGMGIPAKTSNGFGMKLMRYRATVLQGDLLVHKRFPRGTTISCVCPNRALATPRGLSLVANNEPQPRDEARALVAEKATIAVDTEASHAILDILLVEDLDSDAQLTLHALRKQCLIHSVVRVRDGLEALQYVYREGIYQGRADSLPDLILLDIRMPRVDGLEVLRTLKADELTRSLPIIVITGSEEERDLLQSRTLSTTGYVVKPLSFDKFVNAVTQAGLQWVMTKPRQPFQT